jgi:hypothetical protein
MRLINRRTLRLKEFLESNTPTYAILSHTWDGDEVLYQGWTGKTDQIAPASGFLKVSGACKRTRRDGHSWLWGDIIYLEKIGSAELTQVINSMYT